MPLAVRTRSQDLEYSLLHDVKAAGKKIGYYMEQPIYESIIDGYGRRYVFSGLAPRDVSGTLNPYALQKGEFILKPGLAYRLAMAA